MNNETKFETYSFTHHDEDNVSINLTFTVPAVGAHISTFYESISDIYLFWQCFYNLNNNSLYLHINSIFTVI